MQDRKATIVVGLGFGDEGKGTTVDYLTRQAHQPTIVRFNGGAQAAHTVYTDDGCRHTFNQFGSGTLIPDARTHLSKHVLYDPFALIEEYGRLRALGVRDALERLTVDRQALVVTSFHKALNRFRELARGKDAHGSCGAGIGETMSHALKYAEDALRAGELESFDAVCSKMRRIHEYCTEEASRLKAAVSELRGSSQEAIANANDMLSSARSRDIVEREAEALWRYARSATLVDDDFLKRAAAVGDLIFEGAQGVLLDEWFGFHPHTTWSTTTTTNARELLKSICYPYTVESLGVVRAYSTRHGQGPFPTEDDPLSEVLSESDNNGDGWQGRFRVGWFDKVLTQYAIQQSGGIDGLVVTHLDRMETVRDQLQLSWKMCTSYLVNTPELVCDIHNAVRYPVTWSYVRSRTMQITQLHRYQPREDLLEAEELTRVLTAAIPKYGVSLSPCSDGNMATAVVDSIGEALQKPVVLTSHGKTAAHKLRHGCR